MHGAPSGSGEAVRPDRVSYWMDSTAGDAGRWATPLRSAEADVVVVGAGIVGITCALRLAEAGLDVLVLEAARLCGGVSGYTTAKLTVGHGLLYSHLEDAFGAEAAALYAQAQLAGLDLVRSLVEANGIECDLEQAANYVFAEEEDEVGRLEAETAAARRAGLAAEDAHDLDVPFPAVAATMLPDQAQFHPRKYLLATAALAEAAGARIVTSQRVTEITGRRPIEVSTEHGRVRAPTVVVATHYPIVEQGFFVPRIHPRRSYVVAAPLVDSAATGMYINAGSPTRSVRTARLDDGGRLLLVGGEGHRVGQETDTSERYARLEDYLQAHFAVGETRYRWSTQDNHSVDRLPFVGRTEAPGLYVATGFAGWGMSNGTAAAIAIAESITGEAPQWARLFELDRGLLLRGGSSLLREGANVAAQQARGPLRSMDGSLGEIGPGQGAIVSIDGAEAAVSHDADGTLRAVRAKCTHMGCVVAWNDAESTWDCPCHGSRFAPDGSVLHGPALHALEPVALPEGATGSP